jgi:hypothetical protein
MNSNGGPMIVSKLNLLKPLINSRRGQHLTFYIMNSQNVFHLKQELKRNLDQAYEYLAPVMSPDKLIRFLAPVHNLISDGPLLRSMKGNLGIFRNEDSFRVMTIPVDVEPTCIVATSFHVKPLLRWMQTDRDFLLLGLESKTVTLFHGNQNSLTPVDKVEVSQAIGSKGQEFTQEQTSQWVNSWIKGITKLYQPTLYVAGSKRLTDSFFESCTYPHIYNVAISPSFSEEVVPEIVLEIRTKHKKLAQNKMDFTMIEFLQAQDHNHVNRNIFQIAKAAIKGKVKKLIIADKINIFGKLDRHTGGLSIHPIHLDSEDDDILDDLAQEVLARGGEVLVLPKEDIPKGRPLLAIIEPPASELSRFETHSQNFKVVATGRNP